MIDRTDDGANKITTRSKRTAFGRLSLLVALSLALVLIFGGIAYFTFFRDRGGQPSLVNREITRLEQIVKKKPDAIDVRVQLAILYHGSGLDPQAMEQLQVALKQNPSHQGALITLGDIHLSAGRYQESLKSFEKVVELNKDNPMKDLSKALEGVYYQMGVAHLNLGRPEEALASLEEALKINRTDADAWYIMGKSYQSLKNWPDAIKSFSMAIQLVPEFKEAYQAIARSYEETGQTNMANYAHAMVSYTTGKSAEAIRQLEGVISRNPDLAEAHLGIGLAYEKTGQMDKAIASYTEAERLQPQMWLADAKLQSLGAR